MPIASLTSAELSDARRFAGYPVAAALSAQPLEIQGDSATLDLVLAALTDDQVTTLRTIYLANLTTLESQLPAAGAGLDVEQAAVYKRNLNEIVDRENLFASWRLKLCFFLGVPAGAGIFATGSSASQVPAAFVV